MCIYIAVSEYCWAKGETVSEALRGIQDKIGHDRAAALLKAKLYKADPTTELTPFGELRWKVSEDGNNKPRLIWEGHIRLFMGCAGCGSRGDNFFDAPEVSDEFFEGDTLCFNCMDKLRRALVAGRRAHITPDPRSD